MISLKSGLLVAFGAIGACSTSPLTTEAVPDWLKDQVNEFAHSSNPPTVVARYDYQGNVVYYVGPRCCDIYSALYDSAGTVLCAPDGGITGQGDGGCPDFLAQRSNEKILWRPKGAD